VAFAAEIGDFARAVEHQKNALADKTFEKDQSVKARSD
jgi:hypothetical protein